MKIILIAILVGSVVASTAFAQGRRGVRTVPKETEQPLLERQAPQIKVEEYDEVFLSVQQGLTQNSPAVISRHFGPQVYVSLPSRESGYYSGNQAYYILQNYLSERRISSLTLRQSGNPDAVPYASGQGRSEYRGSVEDIQVYVSLSKIGNRWMITQLTIY